MEEYNKFVHQFADCYIQKVYSNDIFRSGKRYYDILPIDYQLICTTRDDKTVKIGTFTNAQEADKKRKNLGF